MHESRRDIESSVRDAAESTPLPGSVGVSRRFVGIWCTFLDQLAKDSEAALAAAIAYRELDDAARDVWISALEQDADNIRVPKIAVYAPLLAVETDPARRRRITHAIGPADAAAAPSGPRRALAGTGPRGEHVAVVIVPLYLDFVQVLACNFFVAERFQWVKHEPIVEAARAPQPGHRIEGIALDARPVNTVVDELAVTVLAHQRAGHAVPDALKIFADLFGPSAPDAALSCPE